MCDMSLGLWHSDVELGHGGRRRGEGQVETCRADGPRAVKGGREAWTDGPAIVADIWDIDKCKCTWEWPCWPSQDGGRESSEAQEDFAGQSVEDGDDTCRVAGKRMEYATRGGFRGFGPQNPGGGPDADGPHALQEVCGFLTFYYVIIYTIYVTNWVLWHHVGAKTGLQTQRANTRFKR